MAALQTVAKLLGCRIEQLQLALSSREMKVRGENFIKKLTLAQVRKLIDTNSCMYNNKNQKNIMIFFQAIDARDALAKSIYSSLFDWLVEQINKSLSTGKHMTGRSISILDIYGFESFDVGLFSFLLFVYI